MTRGMCRLVPLFLSFALLAVAPPLLPALLAQETRPGAADTMVTMDFQDVDLIVLVKFISELTGRNFILDERVKGKKVTVISPTKITKEEAYRVFESILEIKGLATVPSGKIIKIVPSKDAVEMSVRTFVGKESVPVTDTLVTRLIPLEYVSADDMAKVLKPLMSRESQIDAYPATNTLILTETASNIDRLVRILQQLDIKAEQMVIEVIPLQYASADILAKQLQELLQAATAAAPAAPAPRRGTRATRTTPATTRTTGGPGEFTGKIIADDRTNSLIILTNELELPQIRELIQKLDYDTPRAYGNIQVYYLEYASSEDTAKVLTDLVSGVRSPTGRNGDSQAAAVAPAIAKTLASFEGEVSITADAATNSLLIVASPRDYQTLANVIEKLDIRRKQVYVEAVVMEVSPSFSRDLGFEFRTATPLQSGDSVDQAMIGGTSFGQGGNEFFQSLSGLGTTTTDTTTTGTSLFPLDLGSTTGLTLGAVFDRVKITTPDGDTISIPANIFLLHAIQSSTKSNILSTPHLIAIDNEEAEIVVGRNVPFLTSTSQTTVSTITQIQRQNVGITLRFTPQITEGDYIQLKLYQEISALIQSPIGQDVNRVGPTTSTRTASNTVLVRDGQTIVVGGLMEDRIEKIKSGVPWLQEIPLLGWLFRFERDNVEKNNLLIFLTPTVVKEDQDVQRLYEQKKREMIQYKDRHEFSDKYMDTTGFPDHNAGTSGPVKVRPPAPPGTTIPKPLEESLGLPPSDANAQDSDYSVTVEGARRLDPSPSAASPQER
ncbi:MAG: type II secretion system secretin GspD [bacterium]